jgi:hypothetical protein
VLSDRTGGMLGSLIQLVLLAVLQAGPPLVAIWVLGVRRLATVDFRWLLILVAVVAVVFTVAGGKSYYTAPVLAALFAAGATRLRSKVWVPFIVLSGVVAVFLTLPVLPPSVQTRLNAIDPEPLATYGWPEFVDQVKRAEATMPPGTPILTSNYGEAGALTVLGGLDNVYSGHNSYADWGPPPGTSPTVLCVGEFKAAQLELGWRVVRPIAEITLPDGAQNEETLNHATIFRCEQPRGSWAEMWPKLRHLS